MEVRINLIFISSRKPHGASWQLQTPRQVPATPSLGTQCCPFPSPKLDHNLYREEPGLTPLHVPQRSQDVAKHFQVQNKCTLTGCLILHTVYVNTCLQG